MNRSAITVMADWALKANFPAFAQNFNEGARVVSEFPVPTSHDVRLQGYHCQYQCFRCY